MVVFRDKEHCSAAPSAARAKPGAAQNKQKDGRCSKAVTGKTKRPPPSSAVLVPRIEQLLADSGITCAAWAFTALHDGSSSASASCCASPSVDRQKDHLFRRDGWQRVLDAVARATAARQPADQGSASSPVPAAASASLDLDDEPMSIIPSDADDEPEPAPSTSNWKARGLPPTPRRERHQKRQSVPDQAPRKRRHSSLSAAREFSNEAAVLAPAGKRTFPAAGDLSFEIGDSEYVEFALRRLLDQLQQIALKALETEWIKVAEPKKQTHYPYTQKADKGDKVERKRLSEGPIIPSWWPIEKSPYIEPHHNKKSGRTEVALALLRLRDRGSSWISRLETASKRVRLYFHNEKDNEFELEREERRNKILECIFTIAKYEEDFYFGGCDGDTKVTAFDLPSLRQQRKKKPSAGNMLNLSETTSRATSIASPSSGNSPSDLVSPANDLSIREDQKYGVRSPQQHTEPPQRMLSIVQSDSMQSGSGMAAAPLPRPVPRGDIHHSFFEQQRHRTLSHSLGRSQIPIEQPYDYNAKRSPSTYENMPMDCDLPKTQQYDIPSSPTSFSGWQPSSGLESYSIPTAFTPRLSPHPSFNPESSFPGRHDFSFQAQDLMTSTAAYQDRSAITTASPLQTSAPVMMRNYSHSQTPVDGFHITQPLALGGSSLYEEGHYRADPNGLPAYSMGAHHQFQ